MGSLVARSCVLLFLVLMVPPPGHAASTSIATGWDRSCAVDGAGGAVCWGDNQSGALGNGAEILSANPVTVSGLSSGIVGIAAGPQSFHSCAVTPAGAAVCWGYNLFGQLGNGTEIDSAVPAPVVGLTSGVTAVVTGAAHSCALTSSGAVLCWGNVNSDGTPLFAGPSSLVPVAIPSLGSGVRAITAGREFTCALTNGGGVFCWGVNYFGQLGDGTGVDNPAPVPVSGLSSGVIAITAGADHACAINSTGTLLCWGYNNYGQLGLDPYIEGNAARLTPVAMPADSQTLPTRFVQAAAGALHTCAVTTAGAVQCWGDNEYNQLGGPSPSAYGVAVSVAGLSSGVKAITAGFAHNCVLTASNGVSCWGFNVDGQLGNGTSPAPGDPQSNGVPQAVTGLSTGVTAVAAGTVHTCALVSGGRTVCWGANNTFQLGDGRAIGIPSPSPVLKLTSGVASVATGRLHSCALNQNGDVRCWGENSRGQLGLDNTSINISSPPTDPVYRGAGQLIAVEDYTCVSTLAGGNVRCWGARPGGVPDDSSGFISGLSAVKQIAGGSNHFCALLGVGNILCWGFNNDGQLGNGQIGISPDGFATVVGFPFGAVQIALGDNFSCAVTGSGSGFCWGANDHGALGNGSTGSSGTPTAVLGIPTAIKSISAGSEHACALTVDGAVYCWGLNSSGQLGNGSTNDSLVAVPVTGLASGVAAITAGRRHTCAITNSGYVLCWGYNSSGGAGDGTFASRLSPAVVVHQGATGSLAANNWFLDLIPGSSKNIPPSQVPPFLANASGNAATAVVDVTASVQFRAQDVGHPIYIFGYVPAPLVHGAFESKDGANCVLAQLNGSGQAQHASSSNLQNLLGNVTTSAGQALTILNNVPATNVAGSTFCVGTATTSGQAVDPTNSQCVATVPPLSADGQVCLPPSATTVAPNAPGVLSGLWWNPGESGWGIAFTQRRNIVFAAWYTYDSGGNPKWYVASNCTLPAGATGSTGACSGPLYQVSGSAFFGAAFNSALVNPTATGTLQVSFTDANHATMSYSVAGQSRTLPIIRQVFASGASPPPVDYTDLWWNPNESGWGMVITHQFGVMFLAWYVYDNRGNPVWYAVPDCVVAGSGCSGAVFATTGPPLGPTFDPNLVHSTPVGTITATFQDANNGTISFTVNGSSGTKQITRQIF